MFTQLSPRCIDVLEEDPFQLTCVAVGDPSPRIKWFKDGAVLTSNSHRSVTRSHITVNRAQRSDGGQYRYETIVLSSFTIICTARVRFPRLSQPCDNVLTVLGNGLTGDGLLVIELTVYRMGCEQFLLIQ